MTGVRLHLKIITLSESPDRLETAPKKTIACLFSLRCGFWKSRGGKTTSQHHECLVWLPVPPMRACCVPPARGKGVYRR